MEQQQKQLHASEMCECANSRENTLTLNPILFYAPAKALKREIKSKNILPIGKRSEKKKHPTKSLCMYTEFFCFTIFYCICFLLFCMFFLLLAIC